MVSNIEVHSFELYIKQVIDTKKEILINDKRDAPQSARQCMGNTWSWQRNGHKNGSCLRKTSQSGGSAAKQGGGEPSTAVVIANVFTDGGRAYQNNARM